MKLMMVTPYFSPYVGGLENYALNTAKRLQSFGHDVVIVTTNHTGKGRVEETVDGLRVIRLSIQFKLSNTPFHLAWYWQLRRIIHAEQPDIINAHTPVPFMADMAARAARKSSARFVLTYHNDLVKGDLIGTLLANIFYALFINRTLKISDEIIATSRYYAAASPYLQKYAHKVSIVEPGFDPKLYHTGLDRNWLHQKYPGKKIVLITAQMSKTHAHKGVDVLIEAIAQVKRRVPNVQLIAIGKGDGIAGYEKLAAERGITENVTFTGFVPDQELAKYFAGSDVFALPSKTVAEGFGMVLLEASACGVPVVGSNIGGIPFAVEDGVTGDLVPPNDAKALAAALVKILRSPELAKRYGAAGAVRATQHFTWEVLARKAEYIFAQTQNRMQITQIIAHYPPYIGGMEIVAQALSRRLAKGGHDVTVLTTNVHWMPGYHEETLHGYRVKRMRAIEIAGTPIIPGMPWQLLSAPRGSVFHVHLAQAFLPELALIAAKLRGHRFVAHFHLDVEPHGPLGFIFVAYKKFLFPPMLRSADKVVVFSKAQRQLVCSKYGVANQRVVIIPNGANEQYFDKSPRELAAKRKPSLLFVGRLVQQKNVELLLQALDGISDKFVTTIVGDGELRSELAASAKSLKLHNVTFAGQLVGEPLLQAYREADVFVLPSEREGMPVVLVEAMAMGLPVVATDVIGTRDMVTNGHNGLLAPFGDAAALRGALLAVTASNAAYQHLSDGARKTAAQYSWAKLTKDFEKLYREVRGV